MHVRETKRERGQYFFPREVHRKDLYHKVRLGWKFALAERDHKVTTAPRLRVEQGAGWECECCLHLFTSEDFSYRSGVREKGRQMGEGGGGRKLGKLNFLHGHGPCDATAAKLETTGARQRSSLSLIHI